MRFSAILIFSGALFLYSCGQQEEKKKEVTSQVMEEHHHNETNSIELNNGAKWKVVPEMMKHIRNMESDVYRFNESQHLELNDFTLLSKNLQKNIDLLTSNCTMEGKAHDELHKWLLPYIDMVDKLNKSKTKEEALLTAEEITSSFKTLNIYFE
jgi:hypothetical protein